MRYYYVDCCIYLNLWKKEVDEAGKPLWKIAKEFFDKVEDELSIIYYSGYLLKEIMFAFDEKQFIDKLLLFNHSPNFMRITLTAEEYEKAKKLKNISASTISFFDIIHALLARKTNSILITRDKDLIEFAKNMNIKVNRPEEIL